MNLRRRTRQRLYIAHPQPVPGSIGGVRESFSAPYQVLEGMLLPSSGSLKPHETGLNEKKNFVFFLPAGTEIRIGDGAGFVKTDMVYRVTRCDQYPLHVCAYLEERQK